MKVTKPRLQGRVRRFLGGQKATKIMFCQTGVPMANSTFTLPQVLVTLSYVALSRRQEAEPAELRVRGEHLQGQSEVARKLH